MNHIPTESERDEDGTLIVRPKFASRGWTFHMRSIEFITSTLASIHNRKFDNSEWSDAVVKFYNAADTELTDQSIIDTDCVKTVLDFEALYDFEVIGGSVVTASTPAANCRIWVVAVPDVPAASGGEKVMINGLNMRFQPEKQPFKVDGRTSKRMHYNATYHTNKFRTIVRHAAGVKIEIQFNLEQYRA